MNETKDNSIGFITYPSPLGMLYIITDEIGVRKIELTKEEVENYQTSPGKEISSSALCQEVVRQLDEYFAKKRQEFDLPLSIQGTDFQKKVWEALKEIPYGEVRSYKDIAEEVGSPKGFRAIGQANRSNPLPIVIPCHRVIGHSGKMVGYAGKQIGLKEKLLCLEGYLNLED